MTSLRSIGSSAKESPLPKSRTPCINRTEMSSVTSGGARGRGEGEKPVPGTAICAAATIAEHLPRITAAPSAGGGSGPKAATVQTLPVRTSRHTVPEFAQNLARGEVLEAKTYIRRKRRREAIHGQFLGVSGYAEKTKRNGGTDGRRHQRLL